MSTRQEKVAGMLRQRLHQLLNYTLNLDIGISPGFLTVTNVRLSADLKLATCNISLLPGAQKANKKEVIDLLNLHKKKIRYMLTDKIQLKYSPEVRFFYDESKEYLAELDKIIKKVN